MHKYGRQQKFNRRCSLESNLKMVITYLANYLTRCSCNPRHRPSEEDYSASGQNVGKICSYHLLGGLKRTSPNFIYIQIHLINVSVVIIILLL